MAGVRIVQMGNGAVLSYPIIPVDIHFTNKNDNKSDGCKTNNDTGGHAVLFTWLLLSTSHPFEI
jgi:hypothetical protein